MIRIGGLTPLTTIDFPDHLSCVIYCQGCSWRCRYCHNPEMIRSRVKSSYHWDAVLEFLHTRIGLLEAVVFSGGEPLLQNNLTNCMAQVKELGFKVGLHTAGAIPTRFKQSLPYLDWVGFDVKDMPLFCDSITQVKGSGSSNWSSLKLLIESGVDYQCRTTVHWDLIDPSRLLMLTQKLISFGVDKYNIQLSNNDTMLDPNLGYSVIESDQLEQCKSQVKEIFPAVNFV